MNSVTEDYMEEILKTIDKLRDRINKYKEQYSKNERLVRYLLIDPSLRLLGWDTENPEELYQN
jgi:predicted type IV restriction endonuclease